MGGKDLKDYLEVLSYDEAAGWVYSQARVVNDAAPDGASSGRLISITETRTVHQLTMQRVWEVAPHPEAFADERSGAFRKHDIRPFSSGMAPPP